MQINWNSPERQLMIAVLWDAISCFQKGPAPGGRAARTYREAEIWIFAPGPDWLFSFERVCEVLGIDAEYIRSGLRRLEEERSRMPGVDPDPANGSASAVDELLSATGLAAADRPPRTFSQMVARV